MPELAPGQARALLRSLDLSRMVGLRDRAVLGVLTYTGARVGSPGAAAARGSRATGIAAGLAVCRKGGKQREIPVRHDLDEWIAAYPRAIGNCSTYPQTRRILMATQTKPATDALYQALSSPEPDPLVVHAAIEEIRYLSGHNVIAAIGAQITEFRAEMDTRLTRIEAEIKSQTVRIDAVGSRIDVLQRVIWPLIVLIATTVFGLLYRVLTAAPG